MGRTGWRIGWTYPILRFIESPAFPAPARSSLANLRRMSDALLFALAARYGTDIVAVRVEQRPIVRAAVGRTGDNPPFWGGAQINVPAGGCTSGFPWISGVQSQTPTAGYCAPTGGSVSTPVAPMGPIREGSRENWNTGTGTVPFTGQTTLRGDLALIDVTNGGSGNRIYRGDWQSSSSSWVAGKAVVPPLVSLCVAAVPTAATSVRSASPDLESK